MTPDNLKQLKNSADRQSFISRVTEILLPYGKVKRSQILVGRIEPKSDVSCFVEMETPQQAYAAKKDLDIILLGDNCLFFNVQTEFVFNE